MQLIVNQLHTQGNQEKFVHNKRELFKAGYEQNVIISVCKVNNDTRCSAHNNYFVAGTLGSTPYFLRTRSMPSRPLFNSSRGGP